MLVGLIKPAFHKTDRAYHPDQECKRLAGHIPMTHYCQINFNGLQRPSHDLIITI